METQQRVYVMNGRDTKKPLSLKKSEYDMNLHILVITKLC